MKIDKINLSQKNYKNKANKNNKVSDINFKGYVRTGHIVVSYGTSGGYLEPEDVYYGTKNRYLKPVDERSAYVGPCYNKDVEYSIYLAEPDEEVDRSKLKGITFITAFKEPGYRMYFSDIEKAVWEGRVEQLDTEKALEYDIGRNSFDKSLNYDNRKKKDNEQKASYAEIQEHLNSITKYSTALGNHAYLTKRIDELNKQIEESSLLKETLDTNLQNAQRAYDENDEDDEILAELIYARTKKIQVSQKKPISSDEINKFKKERDEKLQELKETEESEEYKNAAVEIPPVLEKIRGIYEKTFPDRITR